MNIKYLGLLFLIISGLSFAANITVYRWVDANNVVHFSQHQPAHGNFTELSMANVPAPASQANTAMNSQEVSLQGPSALEPTANTEQCEEARSNVRTLTAFDKIQYSDADGEVKVLNELEKAQQLEINKKKVDIYCKK